MIAIANDLPINPRRHPLAAVDLVVGRLPGRRRHGTEPRDRAQAFDAKDVDTSKLPKGTKVESYKNGNFEGVKLTTPFRTGTGRLARRRLP